MNKFSWLTVYNLNNISNLYFNLNYTLMLACP